MITTFPLYYFSMPSRDFSFVLLVPILFICFLYGFPLKLSFLPSLLPHGGFTGCEFISPSE